MSSGDHGSTQGTGFVHLNTPASIHYTAGQTLSLSTLRQRKSRVECVVLPESMAVWRRAFQRYTKEEGYGSYAADVEDERMGNGVILPQLVAHRSGPLRRRAHDCLATSDAFFCAPAAVASSKSEEEGTKASTQSAVAASPASPSGVADGASSSAAASTSPLPTKGITIVSHHKVGGRQQFVYPDHDGVLSAGVVPQIVVTEEEKEEAEAAKAFYIAALDMTEEELAALEELQALWKSRARSHSFLGTQHRNAVKGSADPTASDDAVLDGSGSDGRPVKARRVDGGGDTASGAAVAELEFANDVEPTSVQKLEEIMNLADELLRFA